MSDRFELDLSRREKVSGGSGAGWAEPKQSDDGEWTSSKYGGYSLHYHAPMDNPRHKKRGQVVGAIAMVAVFALSISSLMFPSSSSGADDPESPQYLDCHNLQADFPRGVAENRKKARKARSLGFKKPAATTKARQVYRRYASNLDHDSDGVACEVSKGGLWLPLSGNQSARDAIIDLASVDWQYRDDAIRFLRKTVDQQTGFQDLSVKQVEELVDELESLHPNPADAPNPEDKLPSPGPSSTSAPSQPNQGALGDVNPNTFPVHGQRECQKMCWFDKNFLRVRLYHHVSPTQSVLTDKLVVKVTINPTRKKTVDGGSFGSRIDYTMLYSPNEGHFHQMHMDAWGINSGFVMFWGHQGQSKDYEQKSTGHFYAKNDQDLAGKRLTVAVALWSRTQVGSQSEWLYDGAKTKDCRGLTDGPGCKYENDL